MNGAVADLAGKQDIVELLHRRAMGADRFDVALMRACHPLDATDNHGSFQGSMHGFIDDLERRSRDGPPCFSKQHVVANALVDFHGEDEAFVESYHVAYEVFDEPRGVTDYQIGGRYLDLVRRIRGQWQIQHRDIVYDWSRVMPASPLPRDHPTDLVGTRTSDDPLYAHKPDWRGTLPPGSSLLTLQDTLSMDDLTKLLAKQAIAEVLFRRARAGDRSDAELAHTCYHPGATERHGMFDGLATEFIDVVSFTRPRPGSPIKGMHHVVTNVLVDFDGDTKAFVESYHVAWCQMTDATDATIGGRYLDRFELRDGRWAIVHRDVIFDWSRVEPETEKFWDKHPAMPFLYGKRGADDPLYAYTARGR